MCRNRLGTKIHPPPRPRQRMQSSSQAGESSSDRPYWQDLGIPRDANTASLEDERFGATRSSIAGTAGSAKIRGNPEMRRWHSRRMRVSEQRWGSIAGIAGR